MLGSHNHGELGDNASINSSVVPSVVVSNVAAVVVTAGGNGRTCHLQSNKTVYCTGDRAYGALGDTLTSGYITAPVASVATLTASDRATQVIAIAGYSNTFCAVTAEGRVYCWGFGGGYALGNGSSQNAASPGPVKVDAFNSLWGAAVGAGYRLEWAP